MPEEEQTEAPAAEAPAEEPVAEAPAEEPVAETPAEEPVAETPAEEPVAEAPAEEPEAEEPLIEEPEEEPGPAPQEPIMQFFEYAHLPAHLQEVSMPFASLACRIVEGVPRNAERSVALRKLLEAKDAAVRAKLSVAA